MAETLRAHEAAAAGADAESRWYACYTRARAEKRTYTALVERGIDAYLPLAPKLSQWKDRRKLVEFPLFPSYVFGRFAPDELYRVLNVPGVSTLVKSNGRPAAIRDEELENVRRLVSVLARGEVQAEHRPFFTEGQWVEVVDGPLLGVRGVVVENRSRCRVLVGLRAIGQGLEVEVKTSVLKAIAPQ
jgi:transcription antitermination factor NusG